MDSGARFVAAVVLIAAGVGGYFLFFRKAPAPPPPAPKPVPQAVAPAPPPPPPAEPAIKHPIAAERPERPLPGLNESDAAITKALNDLLGKKAVTSFFALDEIARRFVATVDNLANEQSALRLRSVLPIPGAFETATRGQSRVIAASNSARYDAFVRLVDGIGTDRAVAVYRRLYPLFQSAYEELGYPGKHFNDRVVEVIDHLLATPEPPDPVGVVVTGNFYKFEDPALERRSSGQKILLRVGPQNAAKLKAKLADVRRRLASG